MRWYFAVLKKYAVFSGRARRKEYWLYMLFNWIVGFVLGALYCIFLGFGSRPRLGSAARSGHVVLVLVGLYFFMLAYLYILATLVPSIAVAVRRLHDIDLSGWWLLLSLIPLLGGLALLVLFVRDGSLGENRFGANPKDVMVMVPEAISGDSAI